MSDRGSAMSEKVTPWFPPKIQPVHTGWYQAKLTPHTVGRGKGGFMLCFMCAPDAFDG